MEEPFSKPPNGQIRIIDKLHIMNIDMRFIIIRNQWVKFKGANGFRLHFGDHAKVSGGIFNDIYCLWKNTRCLYNLFVRIKLKW